MKQGKDNGRQTILYDDKYDLVLSYELLRCLVVDLGQPLKQFVGCQVDIYDPNGVSVFDVNQPKCVLADWQIIGDTIRPWVSVSSLYGTMFLLSYSDITLANGRMFKLMRLTETQVDFLQQIRIEKSLLGQVVLAETGGGQ